jgi:hypothetical protein
VADLFPQTLERRAEGGRRPRCCLLIRPHACPRRSHLHPEFRCFVTPLLRRLHTVAIRYASSDVVDQAGATVKKRGVSHR